MNHNPTVSTSGQHNNAATVTSSGGGAGLQGCPNPTLAMQNSGFLTDNNGSFFSNNQTLFGAECRCRTGYTCSKCFQKAMEL